MKQNLQKIEKALPVLEAKIKEFTGAEIKLFARINRSWSSEEYIVISSEDLKSQIITGLAAPIFKEIHIEAESGRVRNENIICFYPQIQYKHYNCGGNSADYIWSSLFFNLNSEKWMFDESNLIYKS
ncbi:MAG: hypothetical protein LBK94_09805 [Prevotellaceae bacterium]|nr:hypothetical protein [Prevotellaceae bacterium]